MGRPPARVDVLMSVNGLSFAGAEPAWFIGREDLIKNKLATGRHIDLHDAEQ